MSIHWLDNLYAANIPEDDMRGYLKLEKRPISKDSYYYFGKKKINYNEEIYEYRWLISLKWLLAVFIYQSQGIPSDSKEKDREINKR
jgi:hypothetical protein